MSTRFAGHLPTRVFTQAEWLAMPVIKETNEQLYCQISDGAYRSTLRGRPIVFYGNSKTQEYWEVRPIVRVPMGRQRICRNFVIGLCDGTCGFFCVGP